MVERPQVAANNVVAERCRNADLKRMTELYLCTPDIVLRGQDYKEKHKLDSKQISNSPC